jgi:predicted nucleic acid-binding protein
VNLYLDTSSLIKLYLAEKGSPEVLAAIDEASVVSTSPVAYTEARAALARLRREGQLSPSIFAAAKRELDDDWPGYLTVEVTDALCHDAGDLAEKYGLRGFDSIHLASFAELAAKGGVERARFSSFDDRLNSAARRLLASLR